MSEGSAEGAESDSQGTDRDATDEHVQERVEEIEAERERRLDTDNRPENAVVDNTDGPPEVVREHDEMLKAEAEESGEDTDAGHADAAEAQGLHDEPEAEVVEEIEAERERRLDPDNRPENTEVDNTGRTFEDGHFTDDE